MRKKSKKPKDTRSNRERRGRKKASERKTVAQSINKTPKAVIRARQQQILKMYAQAIPVEQIAVQLEVPTASVTKMLNSAIDRMIAHYAHSTPQQTFVRYAAYQMGIVQKLQRTYERYVDDPDVKQYNAGIQALRSMSDIYDKVMVKGIEFGVIEQRKADRKSIEGKATDIKGELVAEIVQLQKLVETIDEATQAKSMMQGKANPLGENMVTQTVITYTRMIRKPLKNEYGVVRAIPDWKYRTSTWELNEDGSASYVKVKDRTEKQKEMIADFDPDREIHEALAKEQGKILVKTNEGHTFMVDRDRLEDTQGKNKEVSSSQKEVPKKSTLQKPTYLVIPKKPNTDLDT